MGFLADASLVLLVLLGLFLILVVLLQRGRGGGLAGALGGAGGQSAFGTRSGDVFTWITAGTAAVWFLLAGFAGVLTRNASTSLAAGIDAGQVEDDQSLAEDEEGFELQEPAPAAPVEGFDRDSLNFDLNVEGDDDAADAPGLPSADDVAEAMADDATNATGDTTDDVVEETEADDSPAAE